MPQRYRDFRYAHPALHIDLFERVHTTALWSPVELLLRNYAGRLIEGEWFTGSFGFAGSPAVGLFSARVAAIETESRMLLAELRLVSATGQALLDAVYADSMLPGRVRPEMMVTITRSSVDWSMSGVMLQAPPSELRCGHRLRGLMRFAELRGCAMMSATVCRIDLSRDIFALRFDSLPADAVDLLELAGRHRDKLLGRWLPVQERTAS